VAGTFGRVTPAPDERQTRAALEDLRPDLLGGYDAALPGARAAVLARLWGALAREPIAGVARAGQHGDRLVVTLADGRTLTGPAAAAAPFARVGTLALSCDDEPFEQPARLLEALRLPGERARLGIELDNSVANLALARAAAARHRGRPGSPDEDHPNGPDPNGGDPNGGDPNGEDPNGEDPNGGDPLAAAEQSIVDGHPLHPCCRTRIGMSTADVLRYAPEHHPIVGLHLVAIDPALWRTAGSPRPPLLPVHPIQLDRVLASGVARDTGRIVAARPLMSLRTLALVADPAVHLKTAVEVQMTSAVRTLSPPTVHNGPLASALLTELARRTTGLRILREPAAASVILHGEAQRGMAAVWREAPPRRAGRTVLPLAVLAERPGLLAGDRFDALVELMLPPLLTMLHLGAALEAHGQNTLVAFERGRPVEVFYRDVGGILVSPRRLARAGVAMPPLIGAVPQDDPEALRTKLFAALLATVLPSLITAAGPDRSPAARRRRWDRVAATAQRVFADLGGDDEAAFFAGTLPLKATTAMRLSATPLDDVWTRIPNPLSR
jgi:siderophore synthetase component